MERAIEYMGLEAGMAMTDVTVQRGVGVEQLHELLLALDALAAQLDGIDGEGPEVRNSAVTGSASKLSRVMA